MSLALRLDCWTSCLAFGRGFLFLDEPFEIVDHLIEVFIAGDIEKGEAQPHTLQGLRPGGHCAVLVQDRLDLGFVVLRQILERKQGSFNVVGHASEVLDSMKLLEDPDLARGGAAAINLGVDGLEYRVQHNAGADSDILAVVRAIGNSLERNIAMAPKPANTAVSK